MPAAYALTSARIFGPTVRCERTASSWFARNASASALGTKLSTRQRKGQRIEAGDVERGDARGAADELEQHPAIGSGHPARAVRDVGLRLPGHVRDAERGRA